MRGALLRGAGALLVATPFLPLDVWFGEQPGTTFLLDPGEWALGLFVFGTAAWLLSLTRTGPWVADRFRDWPSGVAGGRMLPAVSLGLLLAVLTAAAALIFRGHPLLVDSVAQLFQAKVFAAGAASAPAPREEAFFVVWQFLADGGRWYSQYPPGHAALLAPGVAAGAPWTVPILLSLGTALLLCGFTREAYDEGTARLTLILALFCPFFWLMGASFMNHVSALFFVALLLYLIARWERRDSAAALVGAGLALGAVGIVRPLTGLAVGAALAPFVLARAARRRVWAPLAGAIGGALAMGSLYLLFNALTTGDPLLTGYVQLWGESHGLGFHATPWGGEHTPLAGLRNELTDLGLLNLHLFEWPIPALLPVGLLFLARWDETAWDRRLLLGFLAIPAAYFYYWHRDDYLGPRFLYEGLAFVLPLTARAVRVGLRRLGERSAARRSPLIPENPAAPAVLLLLLCFGYAAAYGIPQRFRVYATGHQSMKVDLRDRAEEAGVERGLVFVAVSWGNRLMADLRGLGLPASTAERAYRSLGHCELELLRRRARAEGWGAERVTAAVERRLARPTEDLVATAELNGDGTLRLVPGRPLAPACRDEVTYDRAGYTVYTPHLLANTPRLDGPIVVARDLRGRNAELRARYPDRPAYLWRGAGFERLP